jgi:hypothetical protein
VALPASVESSGADVATEAPVVASQVSTSIVEGSRILEPTTTLAVQSPWVKRPAGEGFYNGANHGLASYPVGDFAAMANYRRESES